MDKAYFQIKRLREDLLSKIGHSQEKSDRAENQWMKKLSNVFT